MKKNVGICKLSSLALFCLMISSCVVMDVVGAGVSLVGVITDNPVLESTGTAVSSIAEASAPITPAQEYYIGRSVAASILTTYKIYQNEELTRYINKVCQVLVINSNRSEMYNGYHVAVLDTSQINAFASSGGHIFVTKGLLECANSEDALAAILAHEIAHIQLQHGISAIKSSRWTSAVTATAGATLNMLSEGEAEDVVKAFDESVSDIVSTMVNTGYSQSQEYDADETALEIMEAAGYNPHALLDMLHLLQEKQPNTSGGFASTHPSAKKRIKKAEKNLRDYDELIIPEIRYQRFVQALSKMT